MNLFETTATVHLILVLCRLSNSSNVNKFVEVTLVVSTLVVVVVVVAVVVVVVVVVVVCLYYYWIWSMEKR